jgi:hypothetical protein
MAISRDELGVRQISIVEDRFTGTDISSPISVVICLPSRRVGCA